MILTLYVIGLLIINCQYTLGKIQPKNIRKKAEPIVIKGHDVTLKQFSTVEYLRYLLDDTLLGQEMTLKVLKRPMVGLDFYIDKVNI